MIAGTKITLGEQAYVVPALTMRQYVKHRETLAGFGKISGEPTEEQATQIVTLVHECLARNYPDLTIDAVWDGLDMRQAPQAIAAIAGQSKLDESGNA